MKKILFVITIVLLFAGCGDTYYGYEMTTYNFNIERSEWSEWEEQENGNALPYLFVTKKLPAISADVIYEGVVLSYFIDAEERDNLMPYIRPVGINDYGEPFMQNIRFEIEQDFITFIIEASDLIQAGYPDGNMQFKVVVMQNYNH